MREERALLPAAAGPDGSAGGVEVVRLLREREVEASLAVSWRGELLCVEHT